MKQKLITIILTLIAILVPTLIVPNSINENYNILKVWFLLIAGFLLLSLLLASYKTLKIDKKDILLLVFLGLVFISTSMSVNIRKSIIGEKNRYEGLLMFITYACIYLCAKNYFKYEKIEIFLNIMFYVSMAIGILGIAQNYIDYPKLYPIFNKEINAICSTFGNANFFGSYMSIILPIAISIFIFKGNKKSFILSLVMFFNMISSGNRSTWVAFTVVAIIGAIYLIKNRKKEYFKRIAILLVCFILIFVYLIEGFDFLLGNVRTETIVKEKIMAIKKDIKKASKDGITPQMGSHRIAIWRLMIELIKKVPVFGCGVDCIAPGLYQYCPKERADFIYNVGVSVDKAHNEYLQIAATIGIPALVIYLIFIGIILLPKTKYMLKNKVSFIMCVTIISYLVQAFFNISTIGVAPIFWMILGFADNKSIQEKQV